MSEKYTLPDNLTFEQANAMLDETVRRLGESGVTLDESIELYGRACELLAFCVKELDRYKGKITELHGRMINSLRKDDKNGG